MSLAKKCDRCKKFYEHYPKGAKKECNAIKRVYKDETGSITAQENSIDLCPDCMRVFNKFMIIIGETVNEEESV